MQKVVYVKKFEILQKEAVNSTVLSDCLPVIMDLVTCELNVDAALRQSLLRSLVQMVVSSEKVVQKLSVTWKTDVLTGNLLRVMREHVLTQFKHYQLYTHHVIAVMKHLARVMKISNTKEYQYLKTTYMVGKESCTVLDILLKPTQYLVNMNKMFNELGCMKLDKEDANYLGDIKYYLRQVFNKIQTKLDLMSDIIDGIIRRYEIRCQKKKSVDEKWKRIKERLKKIFEATVITPCSFTINLYLNYYFPNEEQMNEYFNTLTK